MTRLGHTRSHKRRGLQSVERLPFTQFWLAIMIYSPLQCGSTIRRHLVRAGFAPPRILLTFLLFGGGGTKPYCASPWLVAEEAVDGEALPRGAVARLGTTRLRQRSPITAIAFSPN